jgi:outer membrane protein OmpA-like peptidoglycan-associated protein
MISIIRRCSGLLSIALSAFACDISAAVDDSPGLQLSSGNVWQSCRGDLRNQITAQRYTSGTSGEQLAKLDKLNGLLSKIYMENAPDACSALTQALIAEFETNRGDFDSATRRYEWALQIAPDTAAKKPIDTALMRLAGGSSQRSPKSIPGIRPSLADYSSLSAAGGTAELAVRFSAGRCEPTTQSAAALDELVDYLREVEDGFSFVIGGHTDRTGSGTINLALSQCRAEWVHRFLQRNGISTAKISTMGYGSDRPPATSNEESCAACRRITLERVAM